MQKLTFIVLIIAVVGLFSCTNAGKENTKSKQELSVNNTCDEFLARYEEWADEYFKAIEDYMNNPSDEKVIAHCTELMQQAIEWSTKWVDLDECAHDEKYAQRFKEISKEIDEKLEELNL